MYQKGKGPDHTPEAAMRSAWQITYAALSHCGLPDIVLRRGLQKRQYSKQNPCAQVDKISILISMLNATTTFWIIRQVYMLWGKTWKESLVDFKFWQLKNMEHGKFHETQSNLKSNIFWIPANNTKPTKACKGHLRPCTRPLGFTTFDDRCHAKNFVKATSALPRFIMVHLIASPAILWCRFTCSPFRLLATLLL